MFNSATSYDAIRITHNKVEIAYDVAKNSINPIYTSAKTFKSVLDILTYVDVLMRMVAIDTQPAQWIEIQANLFPGIMIKVADFQTMHSSGLLADAIRQSIEP